VEPLYSKSYKSYKYLDIFQLSEGSTKVSSNLNFTSSVPNVTVSDVKKTLLDGLNNLTFPVIPSSISAIQTH
ncbi:cell wall protein DAN4-like, partial [Clarias magur]